MGSGLPFLESGVCKCAPQTTSAATLLLTVYQQDSLALYLVIWRP